MRKIAALGLAIFFFGAIASAQDAPITVPLQFTPQEGVSKENPTFPGGFKDKNVSLKVVDARKVKTPGTIGEGTGDEDRVFPIQTEDSVQRYAADVLNTVAYQWGLLTVEPPERIVTVKLTNFYVTESNKALGSMYSGDVTIDYTLTDRGGKTLASGTVTGDTKRYGRARSKANYSEVLSDALKEAYLNMFNEPALQDGWMSGKTSTAVSKASSPTSAPCDDLTPEQRLKRLDDMLKKGLITKDEYTTKRAEIVKML